MHADYRELEKSLAFYVTKLIFVNISRLNPSDTFGRWKFRADMTDEIFSWMGTKFVNDCARKKILSFSFVFRSNFTPPFTYFLIQKKSREEVGFRGNEKWGEIEVRLVEKEKERILTVILGDTLIRFSNSCWKFLCHFKDKRVRILYKKNSKNYASMNELKRRKFSSTHGCLH